MLPLLFRYAGNSGDVALIADSALSLSRAASIVMLVAYLAYLVFQLWTHRQLFEAQEVRLSSFSFDRTNKYRPPYELVLAQFKFVRLYLGLGKY